MLKFSGCSCLSSGRNEEKVREFVRCPTTRTPHKQTNKQSPQRDTSGHDTVFRVTQHSNLPSRRPQTGSPLKPLRFSRPPPRDKHEERDCQIRSHPHAATHGTESRGCADAEADMPSAEASGARCVQNFDGSRNSAIHTTYRISLRSSSIREPRYPLLRVVMWFVPANDRQRRFRKHTHNGRVGACSSPGSPPNDTTQRHVRTAQSTGEKTTKTNKRDEFAVCV